MNEKAANLSEHRRCPACEYDLRGNTSGRCPECGTPILGAASSRLPWIYQRARGGIRAYAQTVALLLFKPRELAAEVRHRVRRQPARRFHLESMALATFLGAGLFAIDFLLRGARWDALLSPTVESLFQSQPHLVSWVQVYLFSDHISISIPIPAVLYRLPMYVWTDRLSILIPVLPVIYLTLRMSAWCYRLFFRIGAAKSQNARRRAARLAYYGSGLAPVLVSIFGILVLLHTLQGEEWMWAVGAWTTVIRLTWFILLLLTPIVFYYPTLTLLSVAGNASPGRKIAMVVLFPALSLLALIFSIITIFWTLGYVTIAIWSMTH
ncbi:MAG TPA: hypothetical protein VM008_20540 [Phycisphaerae bacterium]|nr:hypothetical protein [Phycisphaerae bacterium]